MQDPNNPSYQVPTPEEIEKATAELKAGWDIIDESAHRNFHVEGKLLREEGRLRFVPHLTPGAQDEPYEIHETRPAR